MSENVFWVISYDIKDNRRRLHVANALKNYGTRVQYSVFECLMPEEKASFLKDKLARIIAPQEDSVRYYKLCQRCQKRVLIIGQGKTTEDADVLII